MYKVNLQEASKQLTTLAEAAMQGEEVLIDVNGQTLQLVLVQSTKPRPRFGSAQGTIQIREDFDEPLDDFNEYMES